MQSLLPEPQLSGEKLTPACLEEHQLAFNSSKARADAWLRGWGSAERDVSLEERTHHTQDTHTDAGGTM